MQKKWPERLFIFIFIIVGIVYITKTWSPSSYAYVLKYHYGYENIKPDIGQARPIRSDEWAVVTPLTQATIRNNFERYNKTSLYQEDLRINYGLPIADWGMIFKPTMWLYKLVNPAYAYSFHWFAIFALFISGYAFLFTKFGANNRVAVLLSFSLYFTGFSQFWWNEKGPIIAIFPWTIIPFLLNIRLAYKLIFFYYATVAWLLTNFYPPVQISLAFVGFITLILLQPKLFKIPNVFYLLIASALAAGTSALYLYDYLKETSATLYPGGRHLSGGGVPIQFWLSWIFPGINFTWSYKDLLNMNMSEIGTVGMYYYLAALCFLNYQNFNNLWQEKSRRNIFIGLLIAFLMQCAWILLPIPANIGMILLWDNVQPSRMQFASGVTLTLLIFYTANIVGITFSWHRLLLLAAISTAGWWLFKYSTHPNRWEDIIFLPIIGIAYFLIKNRPQRAHEAIIIASLIFGVLFFGRFNPLQSAWPIFNLQDSEVVKYLRNQEKNNDNLLVAMDLPGATANGLGFRSLSHVTPVPHMEFWEKFFPEMPKDELNKIFNRYSHIAPYLSPRPYLRQGDLIEVPADRFTKINQAIIIQNYHPNIAKAGHSNIEKKYPDALILNGWGGWLEDMDSRRMEIIIKPPTSGDIKWMTAIRTDLPRNTNNKISAMNGFRISLPQNNGKLPECLSLITVDKKTGVRNLIENPPEIPNCQPSAS